MEKTKSGSAQEASNLSDSLMWKGRFGVQVQILKNISLKFTIDGIIPLLIPLNNKITAFVDVF
ncbi:hypothetical protein SAMN05661044_04314 [Olivibacter domesticus]|uniref:Uncharacterized protein n=1 Tax=Olivibacter domesticus TaxID=407022 RepID=A0A1H7VT21_OLID1|nr:hypothetical protein SAMN05661044_04314 [Olivibacter domesticus]